VTRVPRAGRRFVLALVLYCMLPGVSRAADVSDKISAAVNRAFRPLMKEHDVPGLAVAVTVGGKPHFFNYGVASRESRTPVAKDTLFEVGSISKTFTATLATYAQALGKLSLDHSPGQYMPQLRGSAVDRASLLDLGTYAAGGLPLQFPQAVRSDAEMLAYFRQWQPAAAPGEQRRYSNPSIGLLGHVTGLALNGDFADLMETQLFPKLGLGHSYIRVPDAQMGRYAWGYNKDNKPVRVSPGVLDAPAYGVKSTAVDMIRFVEVNLRPALLDAPVRQAVEGTHIAYFRVGGMRQGLGWEQYPYPIALDRLLAGNSAAMIMEAHAATKLVPPRAASGTRLFNKTGSTNGFSAYAAFVPEKKVGLVMLANRNIPIPARIRAAHAVLEQLAPVAQ
jgi:beta-lactamase class C